MKKQLKAGIAALLWASAATLVFAHQDTPGIHGEHDMTGTVKQLDHKSGVFMLETKGGPELHLHFPPDQLKDVKNGDTLTVHLGFTKPDNAEKK
jgi:hypothetical protein